MRLHAGARVHLVRETMASIETRLGQDRFCRVHRGWIVNLDRVREMHVRPNGEHELVTHEGTHLSRRPCLPRGRAGAAAAEGMTSHCRLRIADLRIAELRIAIGRSFGDRIQNPDIRRPKAEG